MQSTVHSWTCATYNTTAVADFTAAVAAEVRRQEDQYDEAAEALRVQRETNEINYKEKIRKSFPSDSQLYREQLNSFLADSEKLLSDELAQLKEVYPLGYEGVDPAGALEKYQLRANMLRHVARLEAERRAAAVAAGDGTSSSTAFFSHGTRRPSPLAKTEEETGGASQRQQQQQINGGSPPTCSTLPVAHVVHVKREAMDDNDADAQPTRPHETQSRNLETQTTNVMSATSVVASPELTRIKMESSGSPSSAHSPSRLLVKWEAAKQVHADGDNGAYLTPHPTAPGAPFPRYISTPSPTSPLSSDCASLLLQAPAFVIPVCTRNIPMAAHVSHMKTVVGNPLSTPLANKKCGAKVPRNIAPLAPSADDHFQQRVAALAEDQVMQLWWRLWPGQRPSSSSITTIPSESNDKVVRPTAVLVKTVATLQQRNFERQHARCTAQQARVAALLAELRGNTSIDNNNGWNDEQLYGKNGGEWANDGDTGTRERQRRKTESHTAEAHRTHARVRKGTTHRTVEHLKTKEAELLSLHRELIETMSQLEAKHAEQEKLVHELLDALELTPTATQTQVSDSTEAGEQDLFDNPASTHFLSASQRRMLRRTQHQQAQRRRGGVTSQRGKKVVSTDVAPTSASQQQDVVASDRMPPDSNAVAAYRHALLHEAFLQPFHLVKQLRAARGVMHWSTTRPDESVFIDSPTAVETIALPPLERDRMAADLVPYMWPTELEARIQHELHGCTSMSNRAWRSYHVALSQDDVRKLEGECAASIVDVDRHSQNSSAPSLTHNDETTTPTDVLSILPPNFDEHVVVLPGSGTHGWLYVQGRGEIVVANLELK